MVCDVNFLTWKSFIPFWGLKHIVESSLLYPFLRSTGTLYQTLLSSPTSHLLVHQELSTSRVRVVFSVEGVGGHPKLCPLLNLGNRSVCYDRPSFKLDSVKLLKRGKDFETRFTISVSLFLSFEWWEFLECKILGRPTPILQIYFVYYSLFHDSLCILYESL